MLLPVSYFLKLLHALEGTTQSSFEDRPAIRCILGIVSDLPFVTKLIPCKLFTESPRSMVVFLHFPIVSCLSSCYSVIQ